jgi:hypothetical protein
VVAFAVLAGTGAYYFMRHLEVRPGAEADTIKAFDAIRSKYASREPLITLVNPQAGDIRITRSTHPQGLKAGTLHVLTWTAEDEERLQTDVPLWLMRFSSVNILSRLGLAPDKFRLTVQDVERYGPGIVVDYRQPGVRHALIWVE